MTATASGAARRLAESAGRILGHFGGFARLRRVDPVKDPLRGGEVFLPSGVEVEARYLTFTASRRKEGGVREEVDRVSVERGPLDPGGLSDRWQILLDGAWVGLSGVALSQDGTTWDADLGPRAAAEIEAPVE